MKITPGIGVLSAIVLVGTLAVAGPPQDLAELSSAWEEHLAERQRPLWAIFTNHWSNATPSKLKLPFTEETTTRWIIDSPPHFLLRTVVLEDGEFTEEFTHGGNKDYIFGVSKLQGESNYTLNYVSAIDDGSISKLRHRIDSWSNSIQHPRPRFYLGANGHLSKLLSEHPAVFLLSASDQGQEGLVLSYARDFSKSSSPIGFLADVRSATFYLSDVHPWLPVRHELVMDEASDRSRKSFSLVKSFDSETKYTRKTFHPDGSEFVTTISSIEERDAGDPELLEFTRLSAYGFDEPAIASFSVFRIGFFLLVGVALIAGGAYLVNRTKASA